MDFNFASCNPLPSWGVPASGEAAGDLDDANDAISQPDNFFDPRMCDKAMFYTLLEPGMWEGNNEGDEDDSSMGNNNKTVSNWDLDEEVVGFSYDEASEVKENGTSVPYAPQPFSNMNGKVPENLSNVCDAPLALNDFANAKSLHITAIAPYAIRDPDLYNGNVGEILTHDSWRRHLAGVSPGDPLPGKEQKDPAAEGMLASIYNSEVHTDISDRAQSEDESDTFDTPAHVAIDDPNDSDFEISKAGAATAHDRSLNASDFNDDAEDDDDDFVVGRHKCEPYRKRRPCRKAPGIARAGTHKVDKTSRRHAFPGSRMTLTSSRQEDSRSRAGDNSRSSCRTYRKHEQLVDNDLAASSTMDSASQATMLVSNGSFTDASSQQDVPQEWLEDKAQRLQETIANLQSDLNLAKAAYGEEVTNPYARDSRKKNRRQAKVDKIQEQLCKAVKDQKRFEKIYGPDNATMTYGSDTAASYLSGQSAAGNTTLPQALREEVSQLKHTITSLHWKVAHCEGQVHAVETDPNKFANRRAGIAKGRITRLENARHSLSHHLQLLEHKQKLYDEEYKKTHKFDSVDGLNGEQMK